MTDLPDPMTPPECDLRDFAFMPLDAVRLRDSDMAAHPDAEVFRAAVLAWCVAWHQIPAASLPDDDATIARLIGMGRDVKGWRKLRAAGALRGFVLCSDSRLYHDVVAEKARTAWEAKQAQRDRTQKAREARLSHNKKQHVTDKENQHSGSVNGVTTASKGEVRDSKGNTSLRSEGNAGSSIDKVCTALGVVLTEDTRRLEWPAQLKAMLDDGLLLDLDILPACAEARKRSIVNLQWVRKRAEGEKSKRVLAAGPTIPVFEPANDRTWRDRLRVFRDKGGWLPKWGPTPAEPGCKCPAEILSEQVAA